MKQPNVNKTATAVHPETSALTARENAQTKAFKQTKILMVETTDHLCTNTNGNKQIKIGIPFMEMKEIPA